MGSVSKFCGAYPARFFPAVSGWQEQTANARRDEVGANDRFSEEAILYLHDNLAVTHGVLRNAYDVYDKVTLNGGTFADRC
jgi:hypothetical protein